MAIGMTTPLGEFPGVGPARVRALQRLGLHRAGDLLAHFPREYEDRTARYDIADAPTDRPVCIAAVVCDTPRLTRIRKGLELIKVKVADESAAMTLTFFNQAYVKDTLRRGEAYIFYGKVERQGRAAQMTNPVFERAESARFTGCIMPVYPLTAGVTNNLLAGLVRRALPDCLGQVEETLPPAVREAHGLAQAQFSYGAIHFPPSFEELELARRRLVFEELFYLSVGLAFLKGRREGVSGPVFGQGRVEDYFALLPFAPTGAQCRVVEQAAADLTAGQCMNRLVQGDVGSGKTAVAAACAYLAAKSGYQTAFMAPTEILARQHYESLTALLAPARIPVALLTGAMTAKEKRGVYAALKDGSIQLVVGTHALFSEAVEFQRLGLVVADEQHRFGVAQRAALAAKGERPHVLVMSATPIPRTLALMIYGDLDVSVIDELPPGRTPVETYLVGEDKRARMYGFVERLVGEGRQVYIVCPMVEESETLEVKAVTRYAETLRERVFPHLRVLLVHGKMKAKEKESVMARFKAGEADVLVSTTVIEVGVDVPNAALMIVENAERFGLSQLHQLRGRVGRGAYQSYCVLVSGTGSEASLTRLRVLTRTGDGFQIAEEDLRLRGPGDFFGARQHGLPTLRVASLAEDMKVLEQAQQAAHALLRGDPDLAEPEHRPVLARVRQLFDANPDMFN